VTDQAAAAAAGSQDNGAGHDDAGDGSKAPVPYERFAASRAEVRALKAEADGLRAKATAAEQAIRERDEARTALAAAQTEHADALSLLRAGISDDEGQAVARTIYGRLPAEGRPALGDWLSGLRVEGAQVPRALAPYLGGQAQAQQQQQPIPPRPAPPGQAPPPAGGSAGDAAIRPLRERIERGAGSAEDRAELARLLGMAPRRA
jgi:hypothetical protein